MKFEALAHLVHPLPPQAPLASAARAIVEQHAAELPDLTGLIVLLPSLHAVSPFARALAAAAGRPALLLPTLTTLPQLATTVSLPQPTLADSARQSLVYAALRERGWLREGDLWAIAGELIRLFDELTLYHVGLPDETADFASRLAEAYRARANAPLQFEARLVHELWHALRHALGDRLDRASAYQLGLARLAEDAQRPLYAVGLAELAPGEIQFLARYAQRQPVHLFAVDPLAANAGDLPRVLGTSWAEGAGSLAERAAGLRAHVPQSPLSGRLRLFPAHSLEQEAQAAALQVRLWLAEGRRNIAVIAQDRLAARRVRALLERAQVLVEDETGWTLSTIAASSVIMRWLDLLAGDFFHQDLLDFLKSPLVFADWSQAERKEAVYGLEQLIRSRSIVARLNHYLAVARNEAAACLPLLERLDEAQQLWPRRGSGRGQTLAAWLDALSDSLAMLGIRAALEADLAGAQLLATLAQLREELGEEQSRFHFREWRRWLDQALETATFRDTGIASPVVFTHLPATRLRRFEGVVLLGCDADKLPARGTNGRFFNQSVRAQLGLPTQEIHARIELADVAALLAASDETLVTWQRLADGEEHLVSPWFDLVQTMHRLAWGEDLLDVRLAGMPATIAPATRAPATPTVQPAPVVPASRIPASISASGYNSLMNCPYQYYARHVLRLNELDEVQVEMEKRDFGELVHAILLAFHRSYPRLEGLDRSTLEQRLREISAKTFAPMLRLNYLSHAWKLRWDALIPDYIAWQLERERRGWRWQEGEAEKRLELTLADGGTLTLHGTLDRVDTSPAGLAVLDYKTRPASALRSQLKVPGEDVQLPVYAVLAQDHVAEACYVSLDQKEIKAVPVEAEMNELGSEVADRLAAIFTALQRGAPLPAQGAESVCGFCEMKGLCRRAYFIRRNANG